MTHYTFTVGLEKPIPNCPLSYILKTYKNRNLFRKYVLNLGIDVDNLPEPCYTEKFVWDFKGKKYFVAYNLNN